METRDIIVLGASAGGFTALQRLVEGLPPDLPASLFIVWHMAPDRPRRGGTFRFGFTDPAPAGSQVIPPAPG